MFLLSGLIVLLIIAITILYAVYMKQKGNHRGFIGTLLIGFSSAAAIMCITAIIFLYYFK